MESEALPALGTLRRELLARNIRCEALVRGMLERIARINPRINAVIATDGEAALAAARDADRALDAGRWLGPLHGIPMTIKDAFEVAGMPASCGSPSLADHVPARDAAAVARLRRAGAIILGKTNVPLYCGDFQSYNRLHGVTANPWDPARTPGGSSGGAAAALAAGLTPAELGSDIGGSLRNPAHFCGVYSHKPTWGLVPMRGHIPPPPGTLSEPELAVAGPMARHAEDLDLLLRLLCDDHGASDGGRRVTLPPPAPVRRVRLWLDDPACPLAGSLRDCYARLPEALAADGVEVVEGPPAGIRLSDDFDLFMRLLAAVIGGGLPPTVYRQMQWLARWARLARRDDPTTLPGYARAATVDHRQWLRLRERRLRRRAQWDAAFSDCDLLLMPVAPCTAFAHQHEGNLFSRRLDVDGAPRRYVEMMAWISPPTIADLPVTTAPLGLVDGLPVGIQIVAPRGHDRTAIAFAAQLARRLPPPVWQPPEP